MQFKKDKTKIKLFQFNLDDIKKKYFQLLLEFIDFFSLYCFTCVYHIWRQRPYI